MKSPTLFLLTLILVLPSMGSSQAAPGSGDRIRIRQVDGDVLTGTVAAFTRERIQLSVDSGGPTLDVPVSAIAALELSLGRQRNFDKYYGITLAASTVLGGLVGLTRATEFIGKTENAAGGLLVGYMVGVPLAVVVGSLVREEEWSPVATLDPARPGPAMSSVTAGEVGLTAGQRIRVRATDAYSNEGVFSGFAGQDLLLSTSQAGQNQRIPVDRLQALWVQERATRKGAMIGGITGGVFLLGVGLYGKAYVLDQPTDMSAGDVALITIIGAGVGAATGALIGYFLPTWSPVWP